MRRKRPFLWIAVFFMAGILVHAGWHFSPQNCAVIGVLILSFAFLFRRNNFIFVILILCEFLCLGGLCHYSRWLFGQDHIYFQREKTDLAPITLRGNIISDVRRSEGGYARLNFVLALRGAEINGQWKNLSGHVLVNLFQDVVLNYGDDIVLTGKLHRPFEFSHDPKFSYREYLKRQGILYVFSVKKNSPVKILHFQSGNFLLARLYQWRRVASDILSAHFSPSEASLMQAMLLGERLRIPASLKDVFAKTGTTHILAISGLNVGIVVAVLFLLFRMVPGPASLTYGLTMVFIILYVFLTGASPSVVRAGLMSVVFLISFLIERETDSLNTLAFAAFLLLLFDPENIFDIGFQLSFMSVLTILLFYPLFMNLAKPFIKQHPYPLLKFVIESFAVSLSATLGVAGLIAYYFEIVTPVSLLANIFVVPLSTLALILGMGLLVGYGLAPLFAVCIQMVLNLMVWFMVICAKIPWAYFTFKDINIWNIISYYCLVISLWLWLKEPSQGVFRR